MLLSTLSGVGPKIAEKLTARGLVTLQDLWLHLPLRYEDRTKISSIHDLTPGEPAQIEGRVEAVERGFRYRPILRVAIGDDSRSTLTIRFFHFSGAQAQQFIVGRRIRCYGDARPGAHGLEMVHPSYKFLLDSDEAPLQDRLDPVYPSIEGLGPQTIRKLVDEALRRLPPANELELLPKKICDDLALPSLREALITAHRPPAETTIDDLRSGQHPAIKRLALEEMLAHHLSLQRLAGAWSLAD